MFLQKLLEHLPEEIHSQVKDAYSKVYPNSSLLRESLNGHEYRANNNIEHCMRDHNISKEDLINEVSVAFREVLNTLVIDVENDHNSENTPQRYAKMVINETMSGRYSRSPDVTDFPNAGSVDQVIVMKRIRVDSICSHHHQNFRGFAYIGILPDPKGNVIGLSKYSRIVRWFASRPQIQEELTAQIAEFIQETIQPLGVAVMIESEHQCMTVRGVQEHDSTCRTVHLMGAFRDFQDIRDEFYRSISPINMNF